MFIQEVSQCPRLDVRNLSRRVLEGCRAGRSMYTNRKDSGTCTQIHRSDLDVASKCRQVEFEDAQELWMGFYAQNRRTDLGPDNSRGVTDVGAYIDYG